ncbi:hypothetical protein JHK86_006242 [Glycine max]|nr:hypothetical protein JHK86_006242 [Glycine max]
MKILLVNHDSSSDSRSTSGSCVREIAESHFGNAKQSRYVQTNLDLPPIHSNSSSFDDQRDRTSQQGHPKAELESVIRKMEEGTRLVFKHHEGKSGAFVSDFVMQERDVANFRPN